jgi:hypothetical protein
MNKSIAVCGDSWFAAEPNFPNKSFGEIICDRNDWKLWSLARGGCSNFAIALQVDKAIELKADFVVVGTTTPDRSEFPIINEKNYSIWEILKKSFSWKSWFHTQPEVYVKSRGISNILHTNSVSSTYEWICDPTIMSESLNNLMFYNNNKLTAEQRHALGEYMLNLYDSGIKRQIDCWIISDACRRLEQANIPYIIFIENLYQWDFHHDIDWIEETKIIRPRDFLVFGLPRGSAPFHYCPEQGGKIFADYAESRIKFFI